MTYRVTAGWDAFPTGSVPQGFAPPECLLSRERTDPSRSLIALDLSTESCRYQRSTRSPTRSVRGRPSEAMPFVAAVRFT